MTLSKMAYSSPCVSMAVLALGTPGKGAAWNVVAHDHAIRVEVERGVVVLAARAADPLEPVERDAHVLAVGGDDDPLVVLLDEN